MADAESDDRRNQIEFDKPHSARVWDAMRGGKNNYDVDREAAADWIGVDPGIEAYAKASRPYIQRVVRYLAGEGIRQFLDVGTGLPTDQNTHEIAQSVAPDARIAYVDNDPLVLTHARALLTNTTDEGVVSYIDVDAQQPDEVIAQARHILNLREPVAVMMFNILGHIESLDEACSMVRTLMNAMTPGSFFAHSDGIDTPTALVAQQKYKDTGAVPYWNRPLEAFRRIYGAPGLEMVEPGLVPISQWRPNVGSPDPVPAYGGVARKTA